MYSSEPELDGGGKHVDALKKELRDMYSSYLNPANHDNADTLRMSVIRNPDLESEFAASYRHHLARGEAAMAPFTKYNYPVSKRRRELKETLRAHAVRAAHADINNIINTKVARESTRVLTEQHAAKNRRLRDDRTLDKAVLPSVVTKVVRRGGAAKKVTMKRADFIREHTNLLDVLKSGKRADLDAEYRDQSEELRRMVGGGPIPPNNIIQQIGDQSYSANPAKQIGDLHLISFTPTIKVYGDNGNTIVIGIRGTVPTDPVDLKADASIGLGRLESSQRYQTDLKTIQAVQAEYPPDKYDYYGVGHSLGGALLDLFLKNGMIEKGVSYNPAVQPQDFTKTDGRNSRIYLDGDPMYALMGQNLAQSPEVRPRRKKKMWERAATMFNIPYVSTAAKAYDLLKSHNMSNFEGGSGHVSFDAQLKDNGIDPEQYLKEAQRKATKAGLPAKSLRFANDGVHKLAMKTSGGKTVKFGRVGYGDYLIWGHLEAGRKVPTGTAETKKNTFRRSHSAIKGDWAEDPFSPNSLALSVLWS